MRRSPAPSTVPRGQAGAGELACGLDFTSLVAERACRILEDRDLSRAGIGPQLRVLQKGVGQRRG